MNMKPIQLFFVLLHMHIYTRVLETLRVFSIHMMAPIYILYLYPHTSGVLGDLCGFTGGYVLQRIRSHEYPGRFFLHHGGGHHILWRLPYRYLWMHTFLCIQMYWYGHIYIYLCVYIYFHIHVYIDIDT
jgi:hypothetical protein